MGSRKVLDYTKFQKKILAKSMANIAHKKPDGMDCTNIESYAGQLIFGILGIPDKQNCLIVIKGSSSDTTITLACSLFPAFSYAIEIKNNGKKYSKFITTLHRDSDRKSSTMKILKKKSDRKYFYTDNFLIDKLESYL